MISKQNKKSLRLRAIRMAKDMAAKSSVPLRVEFTGSLSSKSKKELQVDSEGFYDLDFDIIGKFPFSADETYKYVKNLVSSNLRTHENTKTKTRVLSIIISEQGQKYKYDIAIKKFCDKDHNKFRTVVKNGSGGFDWTGNC